MCSSDLISQLKQFNLAYDILIFPKQLPAAIELVKRFPDQRFVLDHLAKPCMTTRVLSPWQEQIRELAKAPNIWCKVSGLVTEAKHGQWTKADFRPHLDVVFAAFAEDRLLFGSDWPVCLLSGSYAQVLEIVEHYLSDFSEKARATILGRNAETFYRIRS